MACLPPSTLDNPLAEAMELTRTAPAQVAAVAIGAIVGVALFALAVVLIRRISRRRPAFLGGATDVVFIPPYATGVHAPSTSMRVARPVPPPVSAPEVFVRLPTAAPANAPFAQNFTPSSALSARAFAKMGYPFADSESESVSAVERLAGIEEVEELASSELCALDTGSLPRAPETAPMLGAPAVPRPIDSIPCALDSLPAPSSSSVETGPMSAVTIGRIVSIDAPSTDASSPDSLSTARVAPLQPLEAPTPAAPIASASRTPSSMAPPPRPLLALPHPTLPPLSSSVMRAASIADLDLDDAPTQLREPLFDEPPQPPRRVTPPKIRQVTPAPPRTAQAQGTTPPQAESPLPPTSQCSASAALREPPRRGMLPSRHSWATSPRN
jgi:hypothetical protein